VRSFSGSASSVKYLDSRISLAGSEYRVILVSGLLGKKLALPVCVPHLGRVPGLGNGDITGKSSNTKIRTFA